MILTPVKILSIKKLPNKQKVYDLSVYDNHNFFIGNTETLTSNCDGLSNDAQRALRNVMEEYAHNTRFILTANYKHKIIPALQSRCQTLDFDQSVNDVIKLCVKILKNEKISIPKESVQQFIEFIRTNLPDIRKIINNLQKFSIDGILQIRDNTITSEFIEKIFNNLDNDICSARQYVIENESIFQNDYHNLMKELLQFIYKKEFSDTLKKRECILIITEYMYRHSFVIDSEINFFACMINLQKVLG